MSAAAPPDLTVVIPAYNEASRIGASLDRLLGYLRGGGWRFEVIVVDDGSVDDTRRVVESRGEPEVRVVRLASNRGKGAAVRAGVLASAGRRILVTDADLAIPIDELARLEPHLAGSVAVVCGSRGLAASRSLDAQPFYRRQMGKGFNLLLRLVGLTDLRDTQCGFKLFDGAVARSVFARSRIDRFAFDVEILWLARRLGYRAVEVPVRWSHVPVSRVHPVRDAARMLWDVLRLRVRPPRADR